MPSIRLKTRDNRPPLGRAVALITKMRNRPDMLHAEVAEVFSAIEAEDSYRTTMLSRALEHLQSFVTRGISDYGALILEYQRWASGTLEPKWAP